MARTQLDEIVVNRLLVRSTKFPNPSKKSKDRLTQAHLNASIRIVDLISFEEEFRNFQMQPELSLFHVFSIIILDNWKGASSSQFNII
jgi:hypothetical protein